MLVWCSRPAARASRRNRSSCSGPRRASAGSTFSATRRERRTNSSARTSIGSRSAGRSFIGASPPVPQPGRPGEDLLEAAQGTDVAVAGGGLLQPEQGRHLVVAQFVKVAEDQHLTVD